MTNTPTETVAVTGSEEELFEAIHEGRVGGAFPVTYHKETDTYHWYTFREA
jgi:hypothetical protein